MKLLIICTILFLSIIEIKTKQLDEGPQTFTNSDVNAAKSSETSAPSQNPQKRLATKEIIMYLTPTQIKALQSGKAYITSQQLEEHGNQEREYLFNLRSEEEVEKNLHKAENLKHIAEPQSENLQLAIAQNDLANSQKAIELKPKIPQQLLYPDLEKLQPSRQLFEPQEKEQTLQTPWAPFTASSFNPILNIDHKQGLLNTEWNSSPVLAQNQVNLKALSLLQPLQNLDIILSPEKLVSLKYAQNHGSPANYQEFESSLELRHKNEMAKQKALAEAEAIANSPPIVIRNYGFKKQLPLSNLEDTALPMFQPHLKSIYPKLAKPSASFYYFAKDTENLH